jgi:predicted negative regulator of RcsB-dependent stress response
LTQALSRNEIARAKAISAELEREFKGSPYVDQAHLFDARIAVEAGDLPKADTLLRDVMTNTKDSQLALVARLRLARVQLAQNKLDDALATLNGAKPGAFEARFRETRGDVLFAKGDKAGALKEYEAAQAGTANRSVDAENLQLKINDLKSDGPVAATGEFADPAKDKPKGAP